MHSVLYKNTNIHYTLRYTNRRKTIGIRITENSQLLVNSPRGYTRDHIERLLLKKGDWILRNLPPKEVRSYCEGIRILYMGERARLCIEPDRTTPFYRDGVIHISRNFSSRDQSPRDLGPRDQSFLDFSPQDSGWIRTSLSKFFKSEARQYIEQRVDHWASMIGVRPRKVLIKDNRSILGSCTPKKTLNFTYRIIMAPPDIIDYVVVHELVHLIHMNHSGEYWKIVKRYIDDVKAKRKWLRQNARTLYI